MERDYASRKLRSRPSKDTVELFRNMPTAFISDTLKKMGVTNHVIRDLHPVSPFTGTRHIAGPAMTMQFMPSSGARPYQEAPYMHTEIVEQAAPGDVLVISGRGGFWGERAQTQAVKQQIEAIICDGLVRDVRGIIEQRLPVFANGKSPISYVKIYEVVGYNVTVECGGVAVSAGDLVVGDDDGVVCIPAMVLDKLVTELAITEEAEKRMVEALAAGRPWREIYAEIHHTKYVAPGKS